MEFFLLKWEVIMEMWWWGGVWYVFKVLFNMVMMMIWFLVKIFYFWNVKDRIVLRVLFFIFFGDFFRRKF